MSRACCVVGVHFAFREALRCCGAARDEWKPSVDENVTPGSRSWPKYRQTLVLLLPRRRSCNTTDRDFLSSIRSETWSENSNVRRLGVALRRVTGVRDLLREADRRGVTVALPAAGERPRTGTDGGVMTATGDRERGCCTGVAMDDTRAGLSCDALDATTDACLATGTSAVDDAGCCCGTGVGVSASAARFFCSVSSYTRR